MFVRLVSMSVAIHSVVFAVAAYTTSLFLGGILSLVSIVGCLAIGGHAHRSNHFVLEDVCKVLWCLAIMTFIVIVGLSMIEWATPLVEMVGESAAILVVLVAGVIGFIFWIIYAQHSARYVRDLLFDLGWLH